MNESRRAPFVKALVSVLFLLSSGLALTGCVFTKTYGGPANDIGTSVRQTPDAGFIVAGGTQSYGAGLEDVYLVKTNAAGNTLWERTYGGAGQDRGNDVQQTGINWEYFVITGYTSSSGAGSFDVYLIKTDDQGNMLWSRTYGGSGWDEGRSVLPMSDGGYVIAGSTESSGAGMTDVYLIRTDANGSLLWEKPYGGALRDYGESVDHTGDGGYIIAGWTESLGAGGTDVYLIKTDSNGGVVWQKTYGGPGPDYGRSVQHTEDGGFIIAGESASSGVGGMEVYLIKTDKAGNVQWTRTYGGARNDYGISVRQMSNGGYLVAGWTESFGAGMADVYVIKTDSTGNVLQTDTFGGAYNDYGLEIRQTRDNGFVVTGYTYSSVAGTSDLYLIKR